MRQVQDPVLEGRTEIQSLMNTRTSTSTKKQTQQVQHNQVQRRPQTTLTLPKQLSVMPDKYRTSLKFWKAQALDLSTTSYTTERFYASGGFPDPLAPTVVANSFRELVTFYASYRIKASKIMVEVVNTSPSSVIQVTVLPTNLDPTGSPGADYNVAARLQPYARSKMASSQGGPVTRVKNSMTTQRIYGNPMVKFDDKFGAVGTSNPENMWFWVIALYSLASIPSDTPVLMNVFIDFEIEFYDRRFINDTTLLQPNNNNSRKNGGAPLFYK